MWSREQLGRILVLDIETASVAPDYAQLSERMQALWDRKAELIAKREDASADPAAVYADRAAIFAEFGKVVCVSLGYITWQDNTPSLKLKSYAGEDERKILEDAGKAIDALMSKPGWLIAAHNGKEFDFPYMGRRYLINGLPMPRVLTEMQNAKPWEVRVIDTMQYWKFGDYKSFTSLDLLCGVLDIPSPKDDMDGSMVGEVYWKEKDYARIARYCEQDVIATAQVLLRFSREPLVNEAQILRG